MNSWLAWLGVALLAVLALYWFRYEIHPLDLGAGTSSGQYVEQDRWLGKSRICVVDRCFRWL